MWKVLLFLLINFLAFTFPHNLSAAYDPTSVPNNRIGIHILDPSELDKAANLVNGNGGDWGYVTIPIQSVDRNKEKWQRFMDLAGQLHIIPIVRIATYAIGDVWARPSENDILDFANFLSELSWPTENRYIIIFNEPNHAPEWGGQINPEEYTSMLAFSAKVFKDKSLDFFILPAGLDADAPNSVATMAEKTFLNRMANYDRTIFTLIDGWTSHSYPNPGFSSLPTARNFASLIGYTYELQIIRRWTSKNLPVFITETGWQHQDIPPQTVARFLKTALTQIWTDPNIIAITPFILSADDGPFQKFSFLLNGESTPQSVAIKDHPKVAGAPSLTKSVKSSPWPAPQSKVIVQEPITPLLKMIRSWFKLW